ncbi:prenyltransferase/squalene oxidase repeat-containing protein [Thiovibrio sp. JS02]
MGKAGMHFLAETVVVDRLTAYVRALAKESGGFGATRRLPATVEDTFHAVAILKLLADNAFFDAPLRQCRSDARLLAYLGGLWPGMRLDFKSVHQLSATAANLEAAFAPAPMKRLVAAKLGDNPGLPACYYAALISGREALPLFRARLGEHWRQRLLPARWTCEEMMMGLEILQAVGQEPDEELREKLVPWFQNCQTADGGFGFMPGTTSFIENSHFCLRALTRLRAKPLDPGGAAAFIAGCQTRNGGFGRRGRAAPFLDATYHAVAGLSFLGGLGPL